MGMKQAEIIYLRKLMQDNLDSYRSPKQFLNQLELVCRNIADKSWDEDKANEFAFCAHNLRLLNNRFNKKFPGGK